MAGGQGKECYPIQRKTAPRAVFPWAAAGSALAELLAAAGRVQTDLLPFHFAGVTGDETCLAQHRLEVRVVVDQGTGDAVARRAGLAGFAAAMPVPSAPVFFLAL